MGEANKPMWWKLKKAQFKLFCAKVKKEIKKLVEEIKKLFVAVVVAEFLIAGGVVIVSNYNYFGLFDTKTVYIEVSHAQNAPERTELTSDEVLDIKAISDTIWNLESTNGTAKVGLNATCKAKGMSNEYGYNPPMCYKDYETVREIVEEWVKNHIDQGMSEKELMCHYSNNEYKICK